jgi:hypothetical protein
LGLLITDFTYEWQKLICNVAFINVIIKFFIIIVIVSKFNGSSPKSQPPKLIPAKIQITKLRRTAKSDAWTALNKKISIFLSVKTVFRNAVRPIITNWAKNIEYLTSQYRTLIFGYVNDPPWPLYGLSTFRAFRKLKFSFFSIFIKRTERVIPETKNTPGACTIKLFTAVIVAVS